MRTIVLVNSAAGAVAADGAKVAAADPDALTRIREAVRAAGLDGDVVAVPPGTLPQAVAEAAARPELEAVVVAGGDGTVSCAAGTLAGTDKALGVLPLGTLNHFARDLGLPADAEAAAAALAAGRWRQVDVGEVNGRVFVNNCSIGLYPEAVKRREERRDQGESKWPAMMRALREAFDGLPLVRLRLHARDRALQVATPLLLVGNNRYETDLLKLGRREVLDEGLLWVYVARTRGAGGMARIALRALAGRAEKDPEFETLSTDALEIEDLRRRRPLTIALDGELVDLRPPLRMRSRPRALRVLVPPGPGWPA